MSVCLSVYWDQKHFTPDKEWLCPPPYAPFPYVSEGMVESLCTQLVIAVSLNLVYNIRTLTLAKLLQYKYLCHQILINIEKGQDADNLL